jgi:Ala-tRNA(Pro) deacylase
MILKKLVDFLDKDGVKYSVLTHSTAFAAQEIAQLTHIPGKEIAKTVIVWMDGVMVMVVLPASHMIDFGLLQQVSGVGNVELATESEFKGRFPECEVGAMPPFGNLFDMRVFVEKALTEDAYIAFNAGTHRELVRMSYVDYQKIVNPKITSFSIRKKSGDGEQIPPAA